MRRFLLIARISLQNTAKLRNPDSLTQTGTKTGGARYYSGQEFTDVIETLARDRACKLFRCEHVNVQPLSGSPMNQAVYMAFLKPGDTVLDSATEKGRGCCRCSPNCVGFSMKHLRWRAKASVGLFLCSRAKPRRTSARHSRRSEDHLSSRGRGLAKAFSEPTIQSAD